MTTIDGSTAVTFGLTSILLFLILYIWTALGLSAVFRKSGTEGWKAWVPVLNLVVLLQIGGLSAWILLLLLIPIVGQLLVWVVLIIACYRINVAFGRGAGLTVVAALLLPLWASILGFGPDRWLGTAPLVGPRRAGPPARYGSGAHRPPAHGRVEPDDYGPDAYAPRVSLPAYHPSTPLPAPPATGWTPPPVPRLTPTAAQRPTDPSATSRFEPIEFDSDLVTDYPSDPPGPRAPARSGAPVIPPVPPSPPAAPAGDPARAGQSPPQPTRADLRQQLPAQPRAAEVEQQPDETTPQGRRSSLSPRSGQDSGRWGGFDLGAVSELTADVTDAHSGAPAPISAVPVRDPADDAAHPAASLVRDPDASTPKSARGSVAAQHTKAEVADDTIDETIVSRRRHTAWSLISPSGAPVAITAEVVILGRKPVADGAYPAAQLVAIDDGTVSKTHARLELRGDRWYVTDLGSTNGVLFATVLGTEVEATPGLEIEAGERFYLGDAEVRLQRSDG